MAKPSADELISIGDAVESNTTSPFDICSFIFFSNALYTIGVDVQADCTGAASL